MITVALIVAGVCLLRLGIRAINAWLYRAGFLLGFAGTLYPFMTDRQETPLLVAGGIGVILAVVGLISGNIRIVVTACRFMLFGFGGALFLWLINKGGLTTGSPAFVIICAGMICLMVGIFTTRKLLVYLGLLTCAGGLLWAVLPQFAG